jgi:hypothetical protein
MSFHLKYMMVSLGQKILKLWRQESQPFGPGWSANITRIRSWTFHLPWFELKFPKLSRAELLKGFRAEIFDFELNGTGHEPARLGLITKRICSSEKFLYLLHLIFVTIWTVKDAFFLMHDAKGLCTKQQHHWPSTLYVNFQLFRFTIWVILP